MIYILKARGKENEKKNLRKINILKKLQKWLNWICLKLNKFQEYETKKCNCENIKKDL